MSAETSRATCMGVLEAVTPFISDFELWCHRTRVTTPDIFWSGLRVPSIQAGLRSTATRLTDGNEFPVLSDAIEEFTTRWITDEPMDNARVFIVTPPEHNGLLLPLDTTARFERKGVLPGRFVFAHLTLLDPQAFNINPSFAPRA